MSDSKQETMKKMEFKIEKFFKESFCANSAKVIIPFNPDEFKINAIVEIDTDDRGIFFIAMIEKT